MLGLYLGTRAVTEIRRRKCEKLKKLSIYSRAVTQKSAGQRKYSAGRSSSRKKQGSDAKRNEAHTSKIWSGSPGEQEGELRSGGLGAG